MKQQILADVLKAVGELGLEVSAEDQNKIKVEYPADATMGDYSSNAALILAKIAKMSPHQLADQIIEKLDATNFESIQKAGPGFINFKLNQVAILGIFDHQPGTPSVMDGKVLLEYFQPNIAKPLHIGHLRTAIIGDTLYRTYKYLGYEVESDTHMGDWGTQFGLLILAYKKYGQDEEIAKDPVNTLNKYYIKINHDAEADATVYEAGKQEFVKLEQGDEENRTIWKQFIDWSMEKFLTINDLMDIMPFDHHWPESFYEDKMPTVLANLKEKGLLVESQGAQIVNLEAQGLGIAVVVKSDGGTTYLLRDLATFVYRKSLGFTKQIYVVDNRQSHAFRQLFAILNMTGEAQVGEVVHVDYGFMSFKGEALSTRKGNMILAQDVIAQAEEKVSAIIEQKNPDLANKAEAVKIISQAALKYYDLSHNPHSDIEFDWDQALDFEGNSGPYLQYTYARLSSIIRKVGDVSDVYPIAVGITETERQLILEIAKLNEIAADSIQSYLPNTLANYVYSLANLANKFYHESPVSSEEELDKKAFRVELINNTRLALKQGLYLLGIKTLEEM